MSNKGGRNMIPISVRVDFDMNGMMYPVYYCNKGVYVRIDRVLSFVTNGQELVYRCRCQDNTLFLRFSHSKWFLIPCNQEINYLLY